MTSGFKVSTNYLTKILEDSPHVEKQLPTLMVVLAFLVNLRKRMSEALAENPVALEQETDEVVKD
jgi:hypothetical protein